VFWEETDASAVAGRLGSDGFAVELGRERFAGEDDDEDVAWVVATDAPPVMVELLLEAYDGWLEEAPVLPPRPLDLPDGPRRVKGHVDRS
jgi:hypothetical protein